MAEIDQDGSGEIDFTEFVMMLTTSSISNFRTTFQQDLQESHRPCTPCALLVHSSVPERPLIMEVPLHV